MWSREEKAQAWINIYTRLLGLELNKKDEKRKGRGEEVFGLTSATTGCQGLLGHALPAQSHNLRWRCEKSASDNFRYHQIKCNPLILQMGKLRLRASTCCHPSFLAVPHLLDPKVQTQKLRGSSCSPGTLGSNFTTPATWGISLG